MTTATASAGNTAGPLHSDHVNYLILRYLQEAGHEASATAFYRDWRRPNEYRDPEDLPFAAAVNRHELVSVIQDGLYHDELVSRVRNEGRRFRWTTNRADLGATENGTGSRPSTSGGAKKKGRAHDARKAADEFPTPPPKRQRKSEEESHPQVNGDRGTDAMDIDAASPSAADAEGEDDPDVVSPTIASPEPEIVEVTERYDSMDVAVQTDGKPGPRTSAMYWSIDKPEARIFHAAFSPEKHCNTLLTAGVDLCRFYELPSDTDGDKEMETLDDPHVPPDSIITACAWHPKGESVVLAIDRPRDLAVGGKRVQRQEILSHDVQSSQALRYSYPHLLQPSPLVLALRFNSKGSRLLALCTNGSRGMIVVWDTTTHKDSPNPYRGPMAWYLLEEQGLDVAWTREDSFTVCGMNHLYRSFTVTGSTWDLEEDVTPATVTSMGLRGSQSILPGADVAQEENYEKIWSSGSDPTWVWIAALESQRLWEEGPSATEQQCWMKLPEKLTALAPTSADSRLCATAFEDGSCGIHKWGAGTQDSEEYNPVCTLKLADESPALALAWSPSDLYLAVSGTDVAQVWERAAIERHIESSQPGSTGPAALVTWRREKTPATNGLTNGEHTANGDHEEEEGSVGMPCLQWSGSARDLILTVGKEVRMLSCRSEWD